MVKPMPDHRLEAIKAFVRRIVQTEHDGNATAAARALKLPQSQISDLFNDRRGLGLVALEKVADYAGVTIDEVIGRESARKPASLDRRRAAAAELAREDGIQEAAIQSVLTEQVRPEDVQRSTLWWALRMKMRELELSAAPAPITTGIRRRKG